MNQTLDIRALLPLQFLCRELSSTGGGAVERLAERQVWGLPGPRAQDGSRPRAHEWADAESVVRVWLLAPQPFVVD